MKIELDITKSVEENASDYFELAKIAKKKAGNAKLALEQTIKKLSHLEMQKKEEKKNIIKRKKEWYEKFRWFVTSEGFLVVGGRDATTNEIIIKKHTQKDDIVFHTEMAGSPFVVIQTHGKKPGEPTLKETAQFTACYSKAWKAGRTIADVFYVNPDQVTKEVPAGEYITKGAFMIYGKKNFIPVNLKLFIGKMDDGRIMAGPENAVKTHCKVFCEITLGNEKTSSIAKHIKAKVDGDDLEDIVRVIPVGSKYGSK